MIRGRLYEQDYSPQFSGHETFPLRYGWLKKAYDAVNKCSKEESKSIFSRPEAIADFGVGKNMVLSMKHWATMTGVISKADSVGGVSTTRLGDLIFAARGLDPFLENPTSLWLLHWKLASNPRKTTWYWAFNQCPSRTFDRTTLAQYLIKLAIEQEWKRSSNATIKRDVECFVRTYVTKNISKKFGLEDSVECPLTELGLIKPLTGKDTFQFVVGPKSGLGMGVFLFALEEFWDTHGSKTLSLETLAHEQGSLGRVFQLDETELIHRFSNIERVTNNHYRWSETAGLKQLIKVESATKPFDKYECLELDYRTLSKVKSA